MLNLRTILPAAAGVLLTLPLSGENLLRNPGFEKAAAKGGAEAWTFRGRGRAGRIERKDAPEGAACGYVRREKGNRDRYVALTQDAPIQGGRSYVLSAVAKGRCELLCYLYDATGKDLGVFGKSISRSDRWKLLSAEIKAPPKAVKIQVRFEIFGPLTGGEAFMDEVCLAEKTDPAAQKKPVLRLASGPEGENALLQWNDCGAKRYLIYRSLHSEETLLPWAIVKGTSWKDTDDLRKTGHAWYAVAPLNEYHHVGPRSENVKKILPMLKQKGRPVVWVDSVLNKHPRYVQIPAGNRKPRITLSLAGNETESVQILVSAAEGGLKGVDVSCGEFLSETAGRAEAGLNVRLLETRYVWVPCPTLNGVEPDMMPDPLPPWRGALDIPAGATQSIWLQVSAKENCSPGLRRAEVTVRTADGVAAVIPVEAKVRNFSLPALPSFKSSFGIFGRYGLRQRYGVAWDSPEYRKIDEKYYWVLVERRLMPRELPVPLLSKDAARFLNDPRVRTVNLSPHDGTKREDVEKISRIVERFRKNGWLEKGYVYGTDEPSRAKYGVFKDFVTRLRNSAGRDVPLLLTVNKAYADLTGYVDIWSPILHAFDGEFLKKRQRAGEQVWWYTCVSPQEPYPTYLVDDCGTSHRVLSWLQVLSGVDGVLYWAVDWWDGPTTHKNDVWKTSHIFPFANGDGYLVYPGIDVGVDGPVTSQRLEIIRDGNEDVEYLNLLAKRLAAHGAGNPQALIAELIRPVARTLTDWSSSPARIAKQREAVAAEIERLGNP